MRILAIDPGMSGGLCVHQPEASKRSGLRWTLADIPTRGEGTDRRIDAPTLRDFIMRNAPELAFIEAAWPRPTDGGMSSFRFGRSCGAIDAVVSCCCGTIQYIAPQVWKKHHGLIGKEKEDSRQKILQIAPELADSLTRKKDHGRAEAALIAIYAVSLCEETGCLRTEAIGSPLPAS